MEILSWVLSIQSALMLWLMGNGDWRGPVVGLVGQVLWLWYVVATKQWGLMPGVVMFTVVNARNCWKMRATREQIGTVFQNQPEKL